MLYISLMKKEKESVVHFRNRLGKMNKFDIKENVHLSFLKRLKAYRKRIETFVALENLP